MGRGIDYGLGSSNIDPSNGIRYGVINQHEVLQAWADSSEADYGEPHCPKCGNEAVDTNAETKLPPQGPELEAIEALDAKREEYEYLHHACGKYACDDCEIRFDGEDAYGDEPNGYYVDDGEYQATQGQDCDIFVLKSPFYTRAGFCSPCAPGACYLTDSCEDGEKAYCFSHDWFEEGKAPYPVYRVDNDELVDPDIV